MKYPNTNTKAGMKGNDMSTTDVAGSPPGDDTPTLTRAEADALLSGIRSNLANVERDLVAFVAGRGWIALGYATFMECWGDRLKGLKLTTWVLTAAVIAQLYIEAGTVEATEVALRGSLGVTKRRIEEVARQVDVGVPVKAISVRGHGRAVGTPSPMLRVSFGDPDELMQVRAIFEAHGLKLEVEALRLVRAEASRLERKGHGNG